jgi:hypothetical protein
MPRCFYGEFHEDVIIPLICVAVKHWEEIFSAMYGGHISEVKYNLRLYLASDADECDYLMANCFLAFAVDGRQLAASSDFTIAIADCMSTSGPIGSWPQILQREVLGAPESRRIFCFEHIRNSNLRFVQAMKCCRARPRTFQAHFFEDPIIPRIRSRDNNLPKAL